MRYPGSAKRDMHSDFGILTAQTPTHTSLHRNLKSATNLPFTGNYPYLTNL